jgi:hypothetical protein
VDRLPCTRKTATGHECRRAGALAATAWREPGGKRMDCELSCKRSGYQASPGQCGAQTIARARVRSRNSVPSVAQEVAVTIYVWVQAGTSFYVWVQASTSFYVWHHPWPCSPPPSRSPCGPTCSVAHTPAQKRLIEYQCPAMIIHLVARPRPMTRMSRLVGRDQGSNGLDRADGVCTGKSKNGYCKSRHHLPTLGQTGPPPPPGVAKLCVSTISRRAPGV